MEGVDRLRGLAADMNESEIRRHGVISVGQGGHDRQTRLDMDREWLGGWHAEFGRLCDAMEAELSEGYMKLPVDRDGKPIRPGETVYGEDGHGWHVAYLRIGDGHSVAATDGSKSRELRPEWLTHQKPPTVEDVLDEFASAYDRIGGEDDEHQRYLNLISEYAAKLRLAGGDE